MNTEIDYVYILVRRDLPFEHAVVQAAHAAIAAAHTFGTVSTHPNLVVCGVPDEDALIDEFNRLKEAGVKCCGFREEDMGNEFTAVCTAPVRGKDRRPMRHLRLLKAPEAACGR